MVYSAANVATPSAAADMVASAENPRNLRVRCPMIVSFNLFPKRRVIGMSLVLAGFRGRRGFRGCLFLRPGSAEDEPDGLVALVARVLEHLVTLVAGPRHGKLPGLRVRARVVDGHVVADRVGIDAREALDQVQGLALGHTAEAPGSSVRREPPS